MNLLFEMYEAEASYIHINCDTSYLTTPFTQSRHDDSNDGALRLEMTPIPI